MAGNTVDAGLLGENWRGLACWMSRLKRRHARFDVSADRELVAVDAGSNQPVVAVVMGGAETLDVETPMHGQSLDRYRCAEDDLATSL